MASVGFQFQIVCYRTTQILFPGAMSNRQRNDDAISEEEVRRLENAFGDDAFCKLMAEYATELSDPKYKAEQEAYLALLETRNELPFGKSLVWPSRCDNL